MGFCASEVGGRPKTEGFFCFVLRLRFLNNAVWFVGI